MNDDRSVGHFKFAQEGRGVKRTRSPTFDRNRGLQLGSHSLNIVQCSVLLLNDKHVQNIQFLNFLTLFWAGQRTFSSLFSQHILTTTSNN